jgi:hypothetical protein
MSKLFEGRMFRRILDPKAEEITEYRKITP